MGTRLLIAAVGVLGLCGTAFSSVASTPLTKERLIAWLDAEAAAAQDPEFLRGKVISYRVHYGKVPTAEQVEALRKEVAGKPDHPQAQQLNVFERRLKKGQDVLEVRAVRFDETRWRISTNYVSLGYTQDDATNGNLNWGLAGLAGQLLIADKDSAEGYASRFGLYGIAPLDKISDLLFASVWCWGAWSGRHVSQTIDGDRWKAVIAVDSPEQQRVGEYVLEGRYDQERGVPIALRRRPNDAFPPAEGYGDVTEMSGHRWNDLLGRFVPSLVTIRNDPVGEEPRIEFLGAETISEADFAALLRLPQPGHSDPWRPEFVIKTIMDTRPSVGRYDSVDATGERSTIARFSQPVDEGAERWRVVGWGALAVVFLVFVALVWKRRSGVP